MNKGELISATAEATGLAKGDVEKALNAILDTVKATVATGDSVQLIGFGSFTVTSRNERQGFNPRTKEPITIPASKTVKFKPGAALKEAVNK